jgi:hypothetical protein
MSSSGYVNAGLASVGASTHTGAKQLLSSAYLSQFTDVVLATHNSCLLPKNPISGQICKVRNDSFTGDSLYIFPQVGGLINPYLAVDTPYILASGNVAEFVCIGSLNWLLSSTSGFGQNVFNIGDMGAGAVGAVTVNETGIIHIPAQTTASLKVLTIPTATAYPGLYYKFIVTGDTLAEDVAFSPTAGTCNGVLINSITAGTESFTCSALAVVTMDANALTGSYIEFLSDGTDWIVTGFTNITGGWV